MLEVQNNADRKTGDAEVIQHLPALMVRNALDRLRVNDQLLLRDKIGDIFSHDLTFIHDPMPLLLRVWGCLSAGTPHKGSSLKSSRANHVLECSSLRLR